MANSESSRLDWEGRSRRMNIDRIANWTIDTYHLFGFFFFIVAGISMYAGKTPTRGHGLVSRTQEPKTFWFIVALDFLTSIFFFCLKK
jgi:hypothetical protein